MGGPLLGGPREKAASTRCVTVNHGRPTLTCAQVEVCWSCGRCPLTPSEDNPCVAFLSDDSPRANIAQSCTALTSLNPIVNIMPKWPLTAQSGQPQSLVRASGRGILNCIIFIRASHCWRIDTLQRGAPNFCREDRCLHTPQDPRTPQAGLYWADHWVAPWTPGQCIQR